MRIILCWRDDAKRNLKCSVPLVPCSRAPLSHVTVTTDAKCCLNFGALGLAALAIAAVIARRRRSADPIGSGFKSNLPYSTENDHRQPKEHQHGYPPFLCKKLWGLRILYFRTTICESSA